MKDFVRDTPLSELTGFNRRLALLIRSGDEVKDAVPALEVFQRYPEIDVAKMSEEEQNDIGLGGRFFQLGYCYFIGAPMANVIKIGFTREQPDGRLEALRAGSPCRLVPLGAIRGRRDYERALHVAFSPFRLHGEWFDADGSLLEYIADHTLLWPLKAERCFLAWDLASDRYGDWAESLAEYSVTSVANPHGIIDLAAWRRRIKAFG